MNRRKALKRSALVLGYALSAGTIAAVMGGCKADTSSGWVGEYLKGDELSTITKVTQLILPSGNSVGAKEALVERFIDNKLMNFSSDDEKKSIDNILASLKQNDFLGSSQSDQIAMITDALKAEDDGMKKIREYTIVGVGTSEVGATQLLKYDPVPGAYIGCMPVEEVGGVWAY